MLKALVAHRLFPKFSFPLLGVLIVSGLVSTPASATDPSSILSHQVDAVFDVDQHTVVIVDRVTVPAGLDHLRLGQGMTVSSITGPGDGAVDLTVAVLHEEDEDGPFLRLDLAAIGVAGQGGSIVLTYGGTFHESVKGVIFSRENVGNEINATISDEGIYLSVSCEWLVWNEGVMATHDLRLDTPAGFETVTQGARTRHEEIDGRLLTRWTAEHPADGLTLIANRYFVHEEPVGDGVISYTFFLEDDARLRATYMERTGAYIDMYEEMIGPYPYAKFATVENWFPTGYGMPSYTLLGGQIIRLPFIPYTSFGHEICHNWWGNSVFVNSDEGNWCEGITVYCADYHYKELESDDAALGYRRTVLKNYAAYVNDPEDDFPLTEFRSRHSGATRAVGYGKSMMVYHMIDRMVGREVFLAGLQKVAAEHKFTKASWSDFINAFAELSGRDLAVFQEQWLTWTGAPFLQISNVDFHDDGVRFELDQGESAYLLDIPVVLTTTGGEQEEILVMDQSHQEFRLDIPGVKGISVDPDCHLFRHLAFEEIEPTISQVLGDAAPTFVMDGPSPEIKSAVEGFAADFMEASSFSMIENGKLPVDLPLESYHANIVFNPGKDLMDGYEAPGMTQSGKTLFLEGKRYSLKEYDFVFATANPYYKTITDLVLLSDSPQRLQSLANRVVHYGKYSWLLMPHGQGPVLKGNWPVSGSPLIVNK
ncbi:MAG: hypothetical protein KOO60_13410 [Gemmatimonadales bacterium]|nr:hypothetical protein [Gemmatimonadales bacterium]